MDKGHMILLFLSIIGVTATNDYRAIGIFSIIAVISFFKSGIARMI